MQLYSRYLFFTRNYRILFKSRIKSHDIQLIIKTLAQVE